MDLKNDGNGMTNIEILKHANRLQLPNFKYYMRDELGNKAPDIGECGVLNLDDSKGDGSHHTCFWKDGDKKIYFDSFGVQPPIELIEYLKSPILYSTYQIQRFKDTNCSEWCLYILNELKKVKTTKMLFYRY